MPFVKRPACPTCGAQAEIFYEHFGARGAPPSASLYPSVRDTLSSLLAAPPNTTTPGAPQQRQRQRQQQPQTQPMVLLTHGFGSGSLLWKAQVPALVEQGYHVVTWDMRGHAHSSSPECVCCYSKQHQVDDMTAVIAAASADAARSAGAGEESAAAAAKATRHGPAPVFFVGHSMGGYDNLLYYFAHPDRVAGLVLYGTGPGFASDKSRLKWNQVAEKMAGGYDAKGLDALRGSDKHKGHRSAAGLALSCRRVFAQRDDDPLYRSLGPDGPLTTARQLGSVAVPVSIVVGARDKGFLGASQMMQRKIPGAVLREVAGGGHLVCERDPEQFNAVLVEELRRVVARARLDAMRGATSRL